MLFRDALLADFDQEMAVTRLVLDRLPAGAFAGAPDDQSASLAALATQVAQLPRLGRAILEENHYDLATDVDAGVDAAFHSPAAVLETFDRHAADVRTRLADLTEGAMLEPWALRRDGQVQMSLPRASAFRTLLLHHLIHQRGQLCVYLRLHGVPLPPMYGAAAGDHP